MFDTIARNCFVTCNVFLICTQQAHFLEIISKSGTCRMLMLPVPNPTPGHFKQRCWSVTIEELGKQSNSKTSYRKYLKQQFNNAHLLKKSLSFISVSCQRVPFLRVGQINRQTNKQFFNCASQKKKLDHVGGLSTCTRGLTPQVPQWSFQD